MGSITTTAMLIMFFVTSGLLVPVACFWPFWNSKDTTVSLNTAQTASVTINTKYPFDQSTRTKLSVSTSDYRIAVGLRLSVFVARELLRLLNQHNKARYRRALRRETAMSDQFVSSALARDSFRLGLMAFMGSQGEEECTERAACEAGDMLSRYYSTSVTWLLAALDYLVPDYMSELLGLARSGAAEGRACLLYRCGDSAPGGGSVNGTVTR